MEAREHFDGPPDQCDNGVVLSDGCKHYERRCHFMSPCCGKVFPCRICHDEEMITHKLDRHNVNQLVCVKCNTMQPVSNVCISCGISFAKYSCSVCRMFDDKDRGQFHCDGCGICRVGGVENFFHCETCCLCLPHSLKGNHKCIENNSKRNCPICLEDIHSSRDTTQISNCGHLMHSSCSTMFYRSGNYRCPICGVSLQKMDGVWKALDKEIVDTPMPDEYADNTMWILCNDCHAVSGVKFHILGLKCTGCGSYNTCGTDAPNPKETEV